jgi:hypothetical protein
LCIDCVSDCFLVLNLSYKLDYFEEAGWEDEWIHAARRLVETKWEEKYRGREVTELTRETPQRPMECKVCYSFTNTQNTRLTLLSSQKIRSTTFLERRRFALLSALTSWPATSLLRPSKSIIRLCGGSKMPAYILASPGWHSITLQFQVRCLFTLEPLTYIIISYFNRCRTSFFARSNPPLAHPKSLERSKYPRYYLSWLLEPSRIHQGQGHL